jgi:hypothetical protein
MSRSTVIPVPFRFVDLVCRIVIKEMAVIIKAYRQNVFWLGGGIGHLDVVHGEELRGR